MYICARSWKPVDSKKYFPGLKIEKVVYFVYFPESYKQCRPPTTQVSFATAGDQFSDGEIHSLRQRCARTKATRTKAPTYLPILRLHNGTFLFPLSCSVWAPIQGIVLLTCRGAVKNLCQTQESLFPSFVSLMFMEQEENDKGVTCTRGILSREDWIELMIVFQVSSTEDIPS